RVLLDCRDYGLLRDSGGICGRRRARRILQRFARDLDELLGAFKLAVFLVQFLQLESERLARGGSESTADLRAKRSAEESACCSSCKRQSLFCDTFEDAPDCFTNRRFGNAADSAHSLLQNAAQKPVQLGFIPNFE